MASSADSLAIGEIDQTVFACPACARPLAVGARRCPGCGVHLLLGVQAQRASIFLAIGLAAGLVLAVVFTAGVSALGGSPSGDPAVAGLTSPSADPTTPPTAAPTVRPVPTTSSGGTVPALSRSALAQAALIDDRLAASADALRLAIAAPTFDTIVVSQILRTASSDAVVGRQLCAHIGAWTGGKALGDDLTSFYTTIQTTAAEGLSASIRNEKAYRAAGATMLVALDALPDLDSQVRDVARDAGISLPPSAAPAS